MSAVSGVTVTSSDTAWSGTKSNGGWYHPPTLYHALCTAVLRRLTPAGKQPVLSSEEATHIEAQSFGATSIPPSSAASQRTSSYVAAVSPSNSAAAAVSNSSYRSPAMGGTTEGLDSGMWAIEMETSQANADGVYRQHLPPLIRIPPTDLPDVYHQLCATMWNAIKATAEEEEARRLKREMEEGEEAYRHDRNELYCSVCEGVWDVLSVGADISVEEVLKGSALQPSHDAVTAQHLPDLVFPHESISSLYSTLCDGVWEILSGVLTEEQEALIAHYEAVPPIAQHLPPLTFCGPPMILKTAPPRKPPPLGCYHVHPVVPRMYHSLLGKRMVNGRGVRLPPLDAVRSVSEGAPHEGGSWACDSTDRRNPSMESNAAPAAAGGIAWMPFLFRDECVGREKIFWEMLHTSIALFPWPMNPVQRNALAADGVSEAERELVLLQHPAMIAGQEAITVVEAFQRRQIAVEEGEATKPIQKEYIYEHRLLTVGTLPLEAFCRRWIHQYRGRKIREARRRELVLEREAGLRLELQTTDPAAVERWRQLHAGLHFFEQAYRRQLELLQLQTFYVLGTVAIRLEQQVALFPLLYGGTMRRTCGFGRISGTTLFARLALEESEKRQAMVLAEDTYFTSVLPYVAQRASMEDIFEPAARRAVEQEEFVARADLEYRLFQRIVHYRNRDVEIYRAVEFDVNVERPTGKLLRGEDPTPDPFA